MNRAASGNQAATTEQFRQTRSFRRHRDVTPLTSEQLKRQSDVLTCAWRHFGEAASAIAFLNTPNDQLEGRPLPSRWKAPRAWYELKGCYRSHDTRHRDQTINRRPAFS